MQTIYEKLARCSTSGEVQMMLVGNGMEILPKPQSGSAFGTGTELMPRDNLHPFNKDAP